MWAVIGVWAVEPEYVERSRRGTGNGRGQGGDGGFCDGTWTVDGHMLFVFADEVSARRYHEEMVGVDAIHGPGVRCLGFDVAEVAAQARGS